MKTALITGGSRGIGLAIARRLAQDGFRCILTARSEDALARAAAQLEAECGQPVLTMTCDVRDEHEVEKTIRQAAASTGRIDVLVNCAGRGGGGITADIPTELWRDVMATNLDSVFFMTRAVLSQGVMPSGGRIINIASTGGKQGVLHGAPYSASKHGVVGLTKAWGLELARNGSGITMNAVCPGFVETEMARNVRNHYAKLWQVDEAEAKRRIEERVPLGRYIEPDEVAAMVSYLASEQAGGVTAQALNVCGGLGNY
ncbi:SDR family NAD(P)-dependent oxidoreductase [Paludibacterium paludis]|uniref:Ketoacyl reductase n=1 Tax=Paludibacterium paludis TaxID=1225769 RepID=A0A918P244_9NEIS|nr:SDR family NAD(P)-dependent oxidoreductase [Paludibacterium paludis]GGY11328.1 putative ketoacyl reductase [Paludibacterium paludis]